MSSINFNLGAVTAVRTLAASQAQLEMSQRRVSTGERVHTAQDNAAYWSIATTMRSDQSALAAVKDALGLGSATAQVAYTGTTSAIKVMDQLKAKLVAAREPGLDRAKIQGDIQALQGQLQTIADAAGFSGQNWLKIDSTAGQDISRNVVAAVPRDVSGNVSVSAINVSIYNATSGATTALYDANTTASAKVGQIDKQYTAASGATFTIGGLDISSMTDSSADLADLDSMVKAVDTGILALTSSATVFGSVKSRIDLQMGFINDLSATFARGVGELVDADLNEESVRISAMQARVSLARQALSIANDSSNAILRLFQ